MASKEWLEQTPLENTPHWVRYRQRLEHVSTHEIVLGDLEYSRGERCLGVIFVDLKHSLPLLYVLLYHDWRSIDQYYLTS